MDVAAASSPRVRAPVRARRARLLACALGVFAAESILPAHAENAFEGRVQRAKRVESSGDGKAYVRQMWKQIGAHSAIAMRECFRTGTLPDTQAFVLVANVLPDGSLAQPELQPHTPMSACYLEHMADAPMPTPPDIFGDGGIPIVIEMAVRP